MQKILQSLGAFVWLAACCFATACDSRTELQPTRKDITEAVYASGNIRPVFAYKAAAAAGGRIARLFVSEGDSVKAGEPLFALKSEATGFNAEAARARLELAQKNARSDSPELAAARAQITAARQAFKQDSLERSRYRRLFEKQAVPRQQYDVAETRFEVAREQLQIAGQQYQSLKNRLQTERQIARNQYRAAAAGLDEYTVSSEIDGIVLNVYAEPGELAAPMQPVFEIGDPSEMIAEIFIDEADIDAVRVGQTVALKLESGGKAVEGKVAKIYPAVNEANRTVRADVSLPARAYVAGVSVEANIIVRRQPNALALPRSAVLPGDSVWVKRDGKALKIKVQTGARDLQYVEITGGLSPETVALSPE